ncbi:hypothetical protein ACIQVL_46455 [Streptomyces sp. NPDC090499]|uniref:hypothetical protein n=1 Tax=Streptomyces sp. NPDC090499 TaxID=3365965 RepID=UPI003812A2A9
MALDDRTDPAQIIAKVGDFADRERAIEVWMYLASQAGWQVDLSPAKPENPDDGDCGIVEVEGLRYRIRLTPRTRTKLADDTGGKLTWRTVFSHAAWAEPVLEPDNHVPYLD